MKKASLLLIVTALNLGAQTRTTVERYVGEHQQEILGELVSLLSIPNVASDKPNIRRNAQLLSEMLRRRGFASEILETDVNPLVYGELRVPGASRTILWYAHYDGQPFDARLWKQESAFKPILRDGRMEEGAREIPNFASLKTYPSGARVSPPTTKRRLSLCLPRSMHCARPDCSRSRTSGLFSTARKKPVRAV